MTHESFSPSAFFQFIYFFSQVRLHRKGFSKKKAEDIAGTYASQVHMGRELNDQKYLQEIFNHYFPHWQAALAIVGIPLASNRRRLRMLIQKPTSVSVARYIIQQLMNIKKEKDNIYYVRIGLIYILAASLATNSKRKKIKKKDFKKAYSVVFSPSLKVAPLLQIVDKVPPFPRAGIDFEPEN